MGFFAGTAQAMQEAITLLGRDAVLRKHTGSTDVDVAKPWLGPTQTTSDFTETTTKMVFDTFKLREMDDTIVKSGDVKVYVSAVSLGTVEPAVGDILVDGTQEYRLMRVLHFKPNEDSIAFEMHARQC
jgi:hypothetical protein